MSNEKELDRFGFTRPDECVMKSQCVDCIHNIGKPCKIFGEKPIEYVRASINKKCPKRKVKN